MKKVLRVILTFMYLPIFPGALLVAQETANGGTGDPEKNAINSFQFVPAIIDSLNLINDEPQYFNYNTNGSNNSFPFNIADGKDIQLLYLPGDFNQPTPAPAGNITSISFRIADFYPLGPWTYSYLTIKMGQSTITSLTAGAFYAPLTTVYYRTAVSLTGVSGQWMTISLDTPFPYDPAKSLIVDLGQCGAPGATGFSMCYTNGTGNRRIWSVGGCPFVYSGLNSAVYHTGLNITPGQNVLIANYPLLSDGIDITGTNDPMTLINAPFQNGGVYCNGIYDGDNPLTGCKVMTPQSLIGFTPNSFEISINFMLTSTSNQFSNPTPIFIGGDSYRWVGFCQYYEGGSHKFSLLTNNSEYTNTQTILSINQWNNARITYNGTTVQAFLNNQLIYTKNVVLVMGGDYNIGATNYSNGTVFKGYLKDLKVYSQKTTKTFGNTTVYPSTSTLNNRMAIPVTFTEAGTIQSISIYHNGGSGGIMLGVYSDAASAPSSRLGITASATVSSTPGWQTVTLTSPVTVSSGQTVWLAWVFQSNPGTRYTAGTPARAQSPATWSGGMPTVFGTASYANYKYSLFCTYTPGPATKYLNVSPTTITLGSASGSTGTFNITSNTTWSITDDASWLSVAPVSGLNNAVITVTATSANTGTTPRTATVTVAGAGVAYKTVTVTQSISTSIKTLGNTTVYGSTSTTANRRAQIITFPEPGTIQSISIYHNGGTGRVLLGVYDDVSGSPGGRLGMTPETVINASAGWQTVLLTSPVVSNSRAEGMALMGI